MSDKITFTLDGQSVEAEAGMTIWEVANGRGLIIPHLCHKPEPGYRSDGNCRACMVEIEGERTLAASCIREPSAGMVVTTDKPREVQARKMVMEMLVADQPAQDIAHDKSSHLWDMAAAQDVSTSRFPKLEPDFVPLLDDSRMSRCQSTSTPAFSAGCACAPAARFRSMTSSAWPVGATMPTLFSTWMTRWATALAWPVANACKPAQQAR